MGQSGETILCPISGDCMAPLLRDGDELLIELGNTDIRPGDVVVFGQPGELRVQRLVSAASGDGGRSFILKADRSSASRPPVGRDQILGKVVEARGSSGHMRLDRALWTGVNRLVWLRSYISIRCLQADGLAWRAVSGAYRLRARFIPVRSSISLLPVRALCRLNGLRTPKAPDHLEMKGG
jgi:hypothetical protein